MEVGDAVKGFAVSARAARGAAWSALAVALSGCSPAGAGSGAGENSGGATASGGMSGNGGNGVGSAGSINANSGASNGGNANGGNANGGTASGGNANGGNANRGASNGGNANGGTASGGNANGGNANGGAGGGAANGGNANGGAGGGAANGGNASGGTAGASGGGGQGGAGSTAFTCNLVLGVSPTGQWFDSGFLSLVTADHWEAIWVAHHYTSSWADPADSAWTMAFDPYPGPAHQCAQGAKTPDRVLFVAVNWTYGSAAQWEADLTKIVQNLQAKYPKLRRIELMTLTRAPGNVVCAQGGSSSETIIPAWTDVAIAAVAAKYPALVVAAPKFEVPQCADFMGGGTAPQYTDAGAKEVAQMFGTYYAAHP